MHHIIPTTSGIYQIACTASGKIYVGSAVNLRRRYYTHRRSLRNGSHENAQLQNAWNKYGESAFEFSILEQVPDRAQLIDREQHWLDVTQAYHRDIGYNLCVTAGSRLGMRHTTEMRQTMSAERARVSPGFFDPEGNPVDIYNLWDFCRRTGLKHAAMLGLMTGRVRMHHGWMHKNSLRADKRERGYRGFISPEGERIPPITNLSEFCRQHGLEHTGMRHVYSGKRPQYKGWTCERGVNDV